MKTNFPYLRQRVKSKNIRIEVMADSMRVGKTTAVKVTAEGLRKMGKTVIESYEDWQNNPYLKKSYKNPATNFLESQKWFIRRKWGQIKDGAILRQGSGLVDVFIQDVSPEMDYCYAETNRRLGRMSDEHFALYDRYFRSLDWSQAPVPDLLVYLSISDDELIRRAMDSVRKFEKVEPEYFLMMKRVNREWLVGLKYESRSMNYGRILKVDTDKLDFAHDEEAKASLVEQVVRRLDLV